MKRPPASREPPSSPDSYACRDYTLVLHRAAKNVMRRGMRVTCPNCLTEYDVPDEAIAGRPRTVRCAHCGHQWRHGELLEDAPQVDDVAQAHPALDAAPLIDVPPLLPPRAAPRPGSAAEEAFAARQAAFMPPPSRSPAPPPPRQGSFRPTIVALLILALVIVVLAAHRPIMRIWPASAGFYQALGLG